MATSEDPRALLRAARKERRVTHPHASYTSTGNLLCNLCECPIKSEASWSAHLHSTGHTLRLSREQDAAIARKADASNGKKRKAGGPADGEGSDGEERKRMNAFGGRGMWFAGFFFEWERRRAEISLLGGGNMINSPGRVERGDSPAGMFGGRSKRANGRQIQGKKNCR